VIPRVITNPEFYDEIPTPVEATTVTPPELDARNFNETDLRLAAARYAHPETP
jgi:hypothetical protein